MVFQQVIERCVEVAAQEFEEPDLVVMEAIVKQLYVHNKYPTMEMIIKLTITDYEKVMEGQIPDNG